MIDIPTVSLADNLRFNLFHIIPYLSRGVFTENRFWVGFWAKRQRDPGAVQLIGGLREKYRSDYLYVYMLVKKSLLVLSQEGIKRILDHSPVIYAEPKAKRKGMSHFQPNALTISRGPEWRDRRTFNESVLEFKDGLHPYADGFLQIVRDEVAKKSNGLRSWDDFEQMFEYITLQVVFGIGKKDTSLMADLKAMMHESNRAVVFDHKSKYFDGFYQKIRDHLASPEAGSLVFLCKRAPATTRTHVENQIPHWMFAMKDTLAINTVRALALILSHPEAEERVREEMRQTDLRSAQDIDSLKYLEACLQEAMRLWPSTLMLVRESLVEDNVGGCLIPAGTHVIIHNGFNHRDARTHGCADRFCPEMWLKGGVDYHFNHLSNGAQVCAGKALALFIGKAVLATLLADNRLRLHKPGLDATGPVPYAYDHFSIKIERIPPA